MDLIHHTLSNGIRLVHLPVKGIVAHCGLIVNTGSCDEKDNEHGIAHFIEHMFFKGTGRRRSYHVLTRLEDVGGELNAYTTKEETAIHASFLSQDYPRALDLIADVAFNSVFPEKEIEKEKDVIIEEINSYLDNPAELIFDEFEEMIYPGQAIGRNILGTVDSVKTFSRSSIDSFLGSNYNPGQIAVCSVGDIPEKKLLKEFSRSFSEIPVPNGSERGKGNWTYRASKKTKKMDTFQNHCIIGNKAYDIRDSKRVGMFLLNNILGG
ncbi:MAG: insulinase family protein, partial [Bacteroidales bacterium]|nr:insulinase family protein [Bacteroidales bacterium]